MLDRTTPSTHNAINNSWGSDMCSPLAHENSVVKTPYDVTSGATIEALPSENALDNAKAPLTVKTEASTPRSHVCQGAENDLEMKAGKHSNSMHMIRKPSA